MRQNALGGASSAATTAALTTPPWVIAIAVPSSAACSSSHARTRASSAVRRLAAVGRGVRVGHPRAHAGRVRRGDLAQRPARPGAEVALGQRGPRRVDGQAGQRRGLAARAAPG